MQSRWGDKPTDWDIHYNGPSRRIWDFPDRSSDGYVRVKSSVDGLFYMVCDIDAGGNREAGRTLSLAQNVLDGIVEAARNKLKTKKGTDNTLENNQLELLISIHGGSRAFKVQEMNIKKTSFIGMNKPFRIQKIAGVKPVGPLGLGDLRPEYRIIFLTVRPRGGYKTPDTGSVTLPKAVLNTLIHEIAHTVANHCVYRKDDHGADFKAAEALVVKLYNSI